MRGRKQRRGLPTGGLVGILIVGVLAAGALGVLLLMKSPQPEPTDTIPKVAQPVTVDVLIAERNLEEGAELKAALFRKESRTAADFNTIGVINGFDQISGAYAKSFIAAGQPLLNEHITFRAPVNSVVPQIRPGYRAITIKLDKETTNEGWARAGVRVDVLWAWKDGSVNQAGVVAQNVRVLSSGMSVSSEFGGESKIISDGESTVTLEVSAEDQKRLKLASGRGDLRLMLRGDEDLAMLPEKTKISVSEIIGSPRENKRTGPTDQGWVLIDGRKYLVIGNTLVPG